MTERTTELEKNLSTLAVALMFTMLDKMGMRVAAIGEYSRLRITEGQSHAEARAEICNDVKTVKATVEAKFPHAYIDEIDWDDLLELLIPATEVPEVEARITKERKDFLAGEGVYSQKKPDPLAWN